MVRKTTNLEWYGSYLRTQVDKGRLPQTDLDVLEAANAEHYAALALLREQLGALKFNWTEVQREEEWPQHQGFDVVITVGGDGTLLAASHHLGEGPLVVGIRSSGTSVGHLCAGGSNEIRSIVQNLAERRSRVRRVSRLVAEITRVSGESEVLRTCPVLNDFLFTNVNPAATTRYRLRLGDRVEEQKSSGIWISTATGSTAAIQAAGGHPQKPEDRCFQYAVRELFRIGTPSPQLSRGLFDPDQLDLEIENRSEHAMLALDGQHGHVALGLADRIVFKRGPDLQIVF